jgi:hypothetical protein
VAQGGVTGCRRVERSAYAPPALRRFRPRAHLVSQVPQSVPDRIGRRSRRVRSPGPFARSGFTARRLPRRHFGCGTTRLLPTPGDCDPERGDSAWGSGRFVVLELALSEHPGGNVRDRGAGSTSKPPILGVPGRLTSPHAPAARARRSVLSHQLLCAEATIIEVHRKSKYEARNVPLRDRLNPPRVAPIHAFDAERNPRTTR